MDEEVRVEFQALKEFVFDELRTFRSEIDSVKETIRRRDSALDAEIESLSNTVKDFEDKSQKLDNSLVAIEEKMDTITQQNTITPKKRARSATEENEKIATSLEDVNAELREILEPIYKSLKYIKDKEKVSKIQLAYIHYWFELDTDNPCRLEHVKKLILEGVKDRMWPKDWKPESVKGDFQGYLLEKIKTLQERIG